MLFWLTYRRCCRKHSICWCHTRKQWKQMDLRWSSHHSNWSKPSRFQEKKHDIEILKPSCVPCSLRASSGVVPMLVAGALGWWLSLFYAYPVHGRNLDFMTRIWGNGLTTPIPKNQVCSHCLTTNPTKSLGFVTFHKYQNYINYINSHIKFISGITQTRYNT